MKSFEFKAWRSTDSSVLRITWACRGGALCLLGVQAHGCLKTPPCSAVLGDWGCGAAAGGISPETVTCLKRSEGLVLNGEQFRNILPSLAWVNVPLLILYCRTVRFSLVGAGRCVGAGSRLSGVTPGTAVSAEQVHFVFARFPFLCFFPPLVLSSHACFFPSTCFLL